MPSFKLSSILKDNSSRSRRSNSQASSLTPDDNNHRSSSPSPSASPSPSRRESGISLIITSDDNPNSSERAMSAEQPGITPAKALAQQYHLQQSLSSTSPRSDLRVNTLPPSPPPETNVSYHDAKAYDDLATPTAYRSESELFPAQHRGAGIVDGIPHPLPPADSAIEGLAPALAPSSQATLPPPLPARTSFSTPQMSPSKTLPPASLAPPQEKRRTLSISSQSPRPASGIAALMSSSLSIASAPAGHAPPAAGGASVLVGKIKTKVKKGKKKLREARTASLYSQDSAAVEESRARRESMIDNPPGRERSNTTTSRKSLDVQHTLGRRTSRGSLISQDPPTNGTHLGPTSSSESSESESSDEDSGEEEDSQYSPSQASRRRSGSVATRSSGRGSMGLPVTGFAVASNKRNGEFHAMFLEVDEGDYLIEDYGCALQKDILVQGRIYVSENHLCFHANIFGWVTNVIIPFADVISIEKKMTAFVIPNAICVSTRNAKHTFASFISRDSTYDVFANIWRLSHPTSGSITAAGTLSNAPSGAQSSSPAASGAAAANGAPPGTGGHAPTQCACGREGKHYSETALDAVFPSSPEKVYNLMFASSFIKEFLTDNQKLGDLQMSDWKPQTEGSNLLTRSTTYIKALNAPVGPKSTKCEMTDESAHVDFDDYVSMITTTRTPDVPSGSAFSVKTRTCLSWAGANSTKVVVTTQVEWTSKSWIRNIIDRSAIEGQKSHHRDLDKAMRLYIKENAAEFRREGEDGKPIADDIAADVSADGESIENADSASVMAKKQRREDEGTSLQWAIDRIVSGGGALFGGLWGLVKTIVEILADIPMSKEVFFGSLIFILLASNIWTYVSLKTTQKSTKTVGPRHRRGGVPDAIISKDEVADVVRSMLMDGSEVTPMAEIKSILASLEDLERRAAGLRARMVEAAGGKGLDALE